MNARIVFAALIASISFTLFADSTTIEGVVRSVDPDEQRVVILTAEGAIVAAIGTEGTPVRFEGSTYRIRNLEVGDRIRMTVAAAGNDQRVESIEVLESVSPAERLPERPSPTPAPAPAAARKPTEMEEGTTLTSVVGKVDQTRPDRNLIRIIAEGGLSWVRVDATNAQTPEGAPFKVSDLTFGETIEAIGRIGSNGEIVATVIRRESELGGDMPAPAILPVDEPEESLDEEPAAVYVPRRINWLDVVEFEGEVVSPLGGAQTLTVRNEVTGGEDTVWCDPSLVVMSDGDTIAASDLEPGMQVGVRALRVTEGLVAQSIRVED